MESLATLEPPSRTPLLTPGEVAHALSISKSTLYRLVNSGDLPSVRVGSQLRFERHAITRYLVTHREGVDAEATP
jgi:excisionase family DNA binding protein